MKKRVLIISGEAWRDEDNGGNVLSNLFEPLKGDFEFAQIYCSPHMPHNKVCSKYFHLSQAEQLKSVFKFKEFGHPFTYTYADDRMQGRPKAESPAYKRHRWQILFFVRDLLWYVSRWRTKALRDFIAGFHPDLIFAPMYGGMFMHFIDRYVMRHSDAEVISYVSDDHLTFRQHSLSPLFWAYRLLLRRQVKKTAKHYSLLYTMTQEQKEEYEPVLHVPMKVLKKGGIFTTPSFQEKLHSPIRLLYGGNLSGNRTRTLNAIRMALSHINKERVVAELVIYTQTPVTPSMRGKLHDGRNALLMGKVSREELVKAYADADILLHVESFERKPRLLTRLSFSTKIIDLMQACRCIVAVCWEQSSPYHYLHDNGIAYCIRSEKEIEERLRHLLCTPQLIQDYAVKAWDFGVRHHQSKDITEMLRNDFKEISNTPHQR